MRSFVSLYDRDTDSLQFDVWHSLQRSWWRTRSEVSACVRSELIDIYTHTKSDLNGGVGEKQDTRDLPEDKKKLLSAANNHVRTVCDNPRKCFLVYFDVWNGF